MRMSIRRIALAGAALALMAIPSLSQDAKDKAKPAAAATSYPGGKPIEMTALFGAASASTQTARVLADGMAKVLGAPVPILDKGGAGGAVGYMYLSQQKPDGHSIVWSSNSISTTFHNGQLPFDYKNLEHVARVTVENPALAVKADSPWKTPEGADRVRQGQPGQGARRQLRPGQPDPHRQRGAVHLGRRQGHPGAPHRRSGHRRPAGRPHRGRWCSSRRSSSRT